MFPSIYENKSDNKFLKNHIKNPNYDEDDDLEKSTILEMYMIRTKSEIWDSPYKFELLKSRYGLFNMILYELTKTFYVRNKRADEKIYHMKKHIRSNQVIIFTPVLSSDPYGENYHKFCR